MGISGILARATGFILAITAFAYGSVFDERVDYDVGDYPRSVCSADFDGVTHYDLAVANCESDNVSILLNNGDGTFQAAVNYPAGDYPLSVCSADFNGDSYSDLAVANEASDNVSILLNNGDGTFQDMVNYPAGESPRSVFSADFDGDTDYDIAVANHTSGDISILFNKGDGTFDTAVSYFVGVGLYSVFSADFDGDSTFDLAVVNAATDSVSILLNNGGGTFAEPANYYVGDYPVSVFSADFDGDSDYDLAVANFHDNNVSVLKNNGDGTFENPDYYPTGARSYSVFSADFDCDLDYDLAVANANSNNVSVLLNNGDGTFADAISYQTGSSPRSVFSADFDGNSSNDLAVANAYSDDVSIFLNVNSCVPLNTETNIQPDPVYVYWSFAFDPMYETVYLGNFEGGYTAGDVSPSSVLLNGSVQSVGFGILPSMEGFDGEVMEIYFPLADFVNTYPTLFDTTQQEYEVTGKFRDQRQFLGTDSVTMIGKNSRSLRKEYIEPDYCEIEILPMLYTLEQNIPNPFNPSTQISYSIPGACDVRLEVFNIMGQHVATLVDEHKVAGNYTITWDSRGDNGEVVSSGVYFYRLQTGEFVETKKMVLMK